MLTDTHCHLYLKQFEPDIRDVLERAHTAAIKHIFLPAIEWESISQMERLTHPEISFHKMAGIHPSSVEDHLPVDENKLFELCSNKEFVAVGETGLDYYWSTKFVDEQKQSLRIHCRIARETGKPVVLHNRDSTTDLLDLIEEEQDGTLQGVWHCFTGSLDEGKRAINMGLYLGVGGVSTFKNAGVDAVLAEMPLDRLLLETDAPYLAPEPHRGKRNEPSYIAIIAEKLAAIKGIPVSEVAEVTSKNALELFGIR